MAFDSFRQKVATFIAPKNNASVDVTHSQSEEAKTVTYNLNPTLEEICRIFGTDIGNIGGNLNSVTYYSCMLIRCNAFAQLPIYVTRYTKERGTERCYDHYLNELLHLRPNPNMSAYWFKWATEFMRLHTGNAYWYYVFKGGVITKLILLDSGRMRIIKDNAAVIGPEDAIYYVYNDPYHGEIYLTSDEICHFKNFATDGIEGIGIPRYLYATINSEQYGQNVMNKKFQSGLVDPLVVEYTGEYSESKKIKLQKKFEEMGGTQNAGKVVPIPSEFKIHQLETKLVNAQFFELQGLTTRRIANAIGVKNFQLNDMEKCTYSNVESMNMDFYSTTMQGTVISYEEEVIYKLIPRFQRNQGYSINVNVDAMLRADLLKRYQAHQIAINNGFETIAEVRQHENLRFIEGTDRLIISNGASIPFDQLGKQYAN